jgi:hypothetical protein
VQEIGLREILLRRPLITFTANSEKERTSFGIMEELNDGILNVIQELGDYGI